MNQLITPDFHRSVVNISATLAELLGAPNQNTTLPVLEKELEKGYAKVVFLCFDGLGIHPLHQNLEEGDFLFQHLRQTLLSTFPSTTTNATRSLLTNQLPLEHGWFGWSMHFPQLHQNVDIFLGRDSASRKAVDMSDPPMDLADYYFDRGDGSWGIHTVFPAYVQVKHPERNHVFRTFEEFLSAIQACCRQPGRQFVYAYYPEPDSTMHTHGVTSPEAQCVIQQISRGLKDLHQAMEDTLFVVSADHGQVDVTDYIPLYEDEALMELLEIYPFLEARAPAFLVKQGCKQEFEAYFQAKYGEDFLLFRAQDLVEKGYFGQRGDKASLLGDYIAVGTYTHKQALLTPHSTRFKGHHTSLTEEMEVPLILLGKGTD
ncbi:MAG: alkaline phosphatase family protein [Acutalibacter sp.]|jgi:hypothetical protein